MMMHLALIGTPLLFSLYINDMGREISEGIEGAVTGDRCYVDICIARSTEMASIGLLFQRFIGIEALE